MYIYTICPCSLTVWPFGPWTFFGESNLFQPSFVMGELLKFGGVWNYLDFEKVFSNKFTGLPWLVVSPSGVLSRFGFGFGANWWNTLMVKTSEDWIFDDNAHERNMSANCKNKHMTGITLALLNWSFWRSPLEDFDFWVFNDHCRLNFSSLSISDSILAPIPLQWSNAGLDIGRKGWTQTRDIFFLFLPSDDLNPSTKVKNPKSLGPVFFWLAKSSKMTLKLGNWIRYNQYQDQHKTTGIPTRHGISLTQMGVSENNDTLKIIHFNRVFHYKPSILGYLYFWKHPNRFVHLHWAVNSFRDLPPDGSLVWISVWSVFSFLFKDNYEKKIHHEHELNTILAVCFPFLG